MDQYVLERRARRLSYFTVLYNFAEGVASVAAGIIAGSISLVGFGLDSFVESLSGSVMIWRFQPRSDMSHEERERLEQRALKLVGYTFYVVAAYVMFESARKLMTHAEPDASPFGIAVTVISLVVMPILYRAKRNTAAQLQSGSLGADSRQTLMCILLSAAVLVGLLANATLGWWQADPLIGAAIATLLIREGREAVEKGELCAG